MLTLISSYSFPVPIPIPLLYLSRTPTGIEKSYAMKGFCALACREYARHKLEPCRTTGKGLWSNTLADRTLPAEPQGSPGPGIVRRGRAYEISGTAQCRPPSSLSVRGRDLKVSGVRQKI